MLRNTSYLFDGVSLLNKRKSNMDSLLLKCGLINKSNAMLAVVCDGVGSLADGDYASGTAVQMLNRWFNETTSVERIGLKLRDIVLEINAHVVTEAKLRNIETASTLSALLIAEQNYYITHVGDSRIYSCENDTLSILTNDDVSESGKLTAYIGRADGIFLQYSEGAATGKTFLICSDGLYKRMDTDFMTEKIRTWNKRTQKEPLEALPRYVIERGEQDNITLALVKSES